MRERQILFSAPMVCAILAGKKTQTRRVIRPEWLRCLDPLDADDRRRALEGCPLGVQGDRLWLREAWKTARQLDGDNAAGIAKKAADAGWSRPWAPVMYLADGEKRAWTEWGFMPRWASRITLEITAIGIERVQSISMMDAIAEGADPIEVAGGTKSYTHGFRKLWDVINASRGFGWDANPWVWKLTFRRII